MLILFFFFYKRGKKCYCFNYLSIPKLEQCASTFVNKSTALTCQLFFLFTAVRSDFICEEESLYFDLATIEAATCRFSNENKIGEGGFGAVYKV